MASKSKSVLIIEDETDAAEMFAEMMRVSGFNVLKTFSSKPALALIRDHRPDVVILDVMMPDISGLDVLREMRSDPLLAHIPVVIVSAKGMPADIQDGLDAGANVYLTKPVSFRDLKEAVEKVLPS
ncbi:MAG: response regulator [Anaerolineales bacterium]